MYKLIIRLSLFCFGVFLLGIGISCFIVSGLGSDAMSTFAQGIAKQFSISQADGNNIISLSMVVSAFMLDRSQIGIGTIIQPFICSLSIQLGMELLPKTSGTSSYMIYFIGLLLMSISIAITAEINCGKTPYDALIFALMKRFNKKYNFIRWIQDLAMLIIGVMLGGTYGFGTIITLLLLGTTAMILMKYIRKMSFVKITQ